MTLPTLSVRNIAIALAVLIVGVVAYRMLSAPRHGTPEAAIGALLDDAAEAARAGRVKDLMEYVSSSYRGGDSGPSTRDELRAYLFVAVARGGEARFLSREIHVDGSSAHVRASMILAFGGVRGIADGTTGARDVELELVLEDDDWKVVAARTGSIVTGP